MLGVGGYLYVIDKQPHAIGNYWGAIFFQCCKNSLVFSTKKQSTESQKVIIKSLADRPYLIKSSGHIFHRLSQFRSVIFHWSHSGVRMYPCAASGALSPWSFTLRVSDGMATHLPVSNTPQLRGLLSLSQPPSNVLSPCGSNMTFVLTHSQCCWIEEFNYGSLTVCLNQSWLPQKPGWTHSSLNRVGVPIKTLCHKHNIPITLCSFWDLAEAVTCVNRLWHFKHVITSLKHLSFTDKASVMMCFIQLWAYYTVLYAYVEWKLPVTSCKDVKGVPTETVNKACVCLVN